MTIDKQALRERYSPKPAPECHICGAEMTIQRMSAGRITYGCTGSTYDDKGCHYAEGRSIADDHYEQSRVTVVDVSDPDVLALLDENIQLQRGKDAIEAVALALRDDMRDAREQLEEAEKQIVEMSRAASVNNHWKPDVCPITGRKFFMWIEHETLGYVPTYGGPFDSYTIPTRDSSGEFSCERYDHDFGGWVGGEFIGLYLIDDDEQCRVCELEERIAELEAREIKPAKGEVLVVVSGFTGCGKSAIAGEIEIAMKAIGVPVQWTNGDAEKHMTGADWLAAIEAYKPTVRIVEVNVPRAAGIKVKGE
ncbi:ead/Ea22-like family protein [Salmonella enterica subsp. salamae]|nr:ead/Ea22-like family protein [Salmonella enterica subsp. salamae]